MRAAGNGVVAKIAARIALAALVAAARWPENGVTFIIGRVPQRKLVQKSCSVAANCHVANVRRVVLLGHLRDLSQYSTSTVLPDPLSPYPGTVEWRSTESAEMKNETDTWRYQF